MNDNQIRHGLRVLKKYTGIFLLVFLLMACTGSRQYADYTLTIAHINDTHSYLEPLTVNLTVNGAKTTAELGGFARLKTALDEMRTQHPALLLLHGGDAVQGTLYFTLFNGALEFDFLNLLKVDALTFGNHEFDRGCGPIPGWIKRSSFPWLSANIDFSREPAIAPLVAPYLIKEINGQKIAVIGVTTEATPQSTLDAGKAIFNNAVTSARRQVKALTDQGVNKIILLSHLGYFQDLTLARQVSGLDIIVGGHTHSLLGDAQKLAVLGLQPVGPYPTEVSAPDGKSVLVVQAWRWGHVLGSLHVDFNPAGAIIGYKANMAIPVGERFVRDNKQVLPGSEAYREILQMLDDSGAARMVSEDPQVLALLAPYKNHVEEYRKVRIAQARNDIVRGLNSGPGPLAADSLLAAVPHARVALVNNGGVRRDLLAGKISVSDVLEILPFADTLILADLTGLEIKTALEEGIDYLLKKYPVADPPPMPYVAGIRFSVRPAAAPGDRISHLEVKENGVYQSLKPQEVYRLVTNSFVAAGRDGFAVIKNAAGFRSDTGIIDSDAFREHLQSLGTVVNPVEQRIIILD
jgi:5'-nucleotidase/UDP-sugar diphosphatase